MTAFCEQMRALMTERRMSLHQLAKNANYDVGYVCKVKNGQKPPSPQLAARLDHVLGANGRLAALAPPRGTPGNPSKPAGQPAEAAHTEHGRRRLAATVRSIRDDLREDARLLHARACQLTDDPLRAALCRGQAIACHNAAEHLTAALNQSETAPATPPSASAADPPAHRGRSAPRPAP